MRNQTSVFYLTRKNMFYSTQESLCTRLNYAVELFMYLVLCTVNIILNLILICSVHQWRQNYPHSSCLFCWLLLVELGLRFGSVESSRIASFNASVCKYSQSSFALLICRPFTVVLSTLTADIVLDYFGPPLLMLRILYWVRNSTY